MSCTESSTISRIHMPHGICSEDKYNNFVNTLAAESVKQWFSGKHFLDGYSSWEAISEELEYSESTGFLDVKAAHAEILGMIKECISTRRSPFGGIDLQVYCDSESYSDEVHDWIVYELLRDEDLALASVRGHHVISDSREGICISSFRMQLDAQGNLARIHLE